MPITRDELIDDHYGWRWSEHTHGYFEKGFGAVTAGLLTVAVFCA